MPMQFLLAIATAALLASSAQPQQPHPAATQTRPEELAVAATNAFGIELFRQLGERRADRNLFLSPYSVAIALTMAAEGARDETLAEMVQVLHLPMPVHDIHRAFAALEKRLADHTSSADAAMLQRIGALRAQLDAAEADLEALRRQGTLPDWAGVKRTQHLAEELRDLASDLTPYELRVANALWVERGCAMAPDFVGIIDRYYGTGRVGELDFGHATEAARRQINGWVEDHTNRRIVELIPAGALSPETRLLIANAVYFRGEWSKPFAARETRNRDFSRADGDRVKVPMMRDAGRTDVAYAAFTGKGRYFPTPLQVATNEHMRPPTYPDDDGFTMIELPYKGGDLAMVVMVPRSPGGLPRLEKLLQAPMLAAWLGLLERRPVDTAMPRFQLRSACELSTTLQALGMHRAFVAPPAAGNAQFGGMSASDDPAHQLYLGSVAHHAWVEVTEQGTEAAAATAVFFCTGSADTMPFIPVFAADRPFLFLIRDRRSGVVLFLGRVTDPRAFE